MRIVLHVDRLVLKGFRHTDQRAFASGLCREFQRQLATVSVLRPLAQRGDAARIEVGAVGLGPLTGPPEAGRRVARSIASKMQS